MPYPNLRVEIESDSGLLIIEAEWRANEWVADYDDFKIRLWPESAAKKGVDHNGFLFNGQSERVYDRAYQKLVGAARKRVNG